jgi:plastocyanin
MKALRNRAEARSFRPAGPGLAALLLCLAGCRGGTTGNSAQAPGGEASVASGRGAAIAMHAKPYFFQPKDVTVSPGETITWTNSSSFPHSVAVDYGSAAKGPNSDADFPRGLMGGDHWSWTVPKDAKPGTRWTYHCRFHGEPGDGKHEGLGMVGTITVSATNSVAKTPP